MNKAKLLFKIFRNCRPLWVPIADRLRLGKAGHPTRVCYGGKHFVARTRVGDFSVLNEIFIHESYRRGLTAITPGGIVLDVGANIGAFSVAAAGAGAGKVYAFEPLENNYALLQENINLNGYGDVIKASRSAVSAVAGDAVFYYNDSEAGGGTFFPNIHNEWDRQNAEGKKDVKECKVACLTLGDYFEQEDIPSCCLLKMDCEGAEYDIVRTMGRIASRIENVIFEYHSDGKLAEIVALLTGYGFKVHPQQGPYQVVFASRSA